MTISNRLKYFNLYILIILLIVKCLNHFLYYKYSGLKMWSASHNSCP